MSDPQSSPPRTAITLCGSLRKDSINEVLRRHMSMKLREAGVSVTDIDLNEFEMPIFNQDIEDAGDTPEAAKRLADIFRTTDIVLIISPEYNGGVPPLVVNVVAWLSRQKPQSFLEDTKVAIISRSPLVSVFGPRSSTSASSRIGLAVAGLKAKALVIPGNSGGS